MEVNINVDVTGSPLLKSHTCMQETPICNAFMCQLQKKKNLAKNCGNDMKTNSRTKTKPSKRDLGETAECETDGGSRLSPAERILSVAAQEE